MNRRSWHFPLLGALIAFILYIPFLYAKMFDLESIGYVLLLFLLTAVFGIAALWQGVLRKRWISGRWVFAGLTFLGVSIFMFLSTQNLRPWARWLVASGKYTNLVMHQKPDPQTGLRYVEWDGWGWAGMNTSVDLVYDPSDTLAREIKYNPKGRFAEVADKTALVQRLGRGWYSLTLYTGEML